jgi:sarcosine oxidase, subunit gamma
MADLTTLRRSPLDHLRDRFRTEQPAGGRDVALRGALAEDPGSVVDVPAHRTTLELSGPAARQALQEGCPVDLHPRSSQPGRGVATTPASIPVARGLLDATTESARAQVP